MGTCSQLLLFEETFGSSVWPSPSACSGDMVPGRQEGEGWKEGKEGSTKGVLKTPGIEMIYVYDQASGHKHGQG